jgi:predicted nucleic acid-binding Zn ribbon protein
MAFSNAGSSFQDVVLKLAGSEYRELVVLALGWKDLLGELLAERAKIRKLENKILFVSVRDNVWMQELVLRKAELTRDIKRKFNIGLNNIVFSLEWMNHGK